MTLWLEVELHFGGEESAHTYSEASRIREFPFDFSDTNGLSHWNDKVPVISSRCRRKEMILQ